VIRVLIVDDQALVRGAFRVLVESAPDMTVVADVGDGAQAVELASHEHPDVVLMDIRMPVMDGLEATRRTLAADPRVRVLVLTTFDVDEYVFEALAAGASGFLLKDARPDDLLTGIRVVAAGEALLAPRATRLLVSHFAAAGRRPVTVGTLARLTEREREVLRLVAQGLSNPEICQALVVSPATVKTHIAHLLAKLDARDRAQLVVAAYISGFMGRLGG